MRASLEIASGTLRIHIADAAKNVLAWREPYVWSCTATFVQNGEVWLSGVTQPVTVEIWRAIDRAMGCLGVRHVCWNRIKANGEGQLLTERQIRRRVSLVVLEIHPDHGQEHSGRQQAEIDSEADADKVKNCDHRRSAYHLPARLASAEN